MTTPPADSTPDAGGILQEGVANLTGTTAMDFPQEVQYRELNEKIREIWERLNVMTNEQVELKIRTSGLERHATATDAMTETLNEVALRIHVAAERWGDMQERQNRLEQRTNMIGDNAKSIVDLEKLIKGDGGIERLVQGLRENQAKRDGAVLAISATGGFLGGMIALAGVAYTWIYGLWHWK